MDVFFTISGFLITGIIFRELDAGEFTFAKFWERRIRRIVPVLLFFLAATILTGWWILLAPRDFASLGSQAASALVGLANFKMHSLTESYWNPQSQNVPLLHTWSLAVEEQFYVVMPFVLWALHRWLRGRTGQALGVMLATSLVFCFVSCFTHPDSNFYFLPGRAWELLLGSLGALYLHRGRALSPARAQLARALGLTMILFSALGLRENSVWPNPLTLLPTVGAALILIAPEEKGERVEGGRSLVFRTLAAAPLRFIGLISYSLYLWHWPVIVFFKEYHPDMVMVSDRWLLLGASLLLAILSWRFIEQPFRNRLGSFRVATKPLLIGAGLAWAGLLVTAIIVSRNGEAAEMAFEAKVPPEAARLIFQRPGQNSVMNFDAASRLREGGIPINLRGRPPRCVILGSSHGQPLGPVVSALCETYDIPCAMLTQGGCTALFAGANTYVSAWHVNNAVKHERDKIVQDYLARWKPDLVIVAGRWARELPNFWAMNPTDSALRFREAFDQTTAWLGMHSSRVVILGQVPCLPLAEGDNALGIWKRYRLNHNSMPAFREPADEIAGRRQAMSIFRERAGSRLTVLDPEPLLTNPDGSLRYFSDSGVLYADDNHLNSLGSMELKPLLEPFFVQLAGAHAGNRDSVALPAPAP